MNESTVVAAVSIILAIVSAYAAFRAAQLATQAGFNEAIEVRRPRPAGPQSSIRSEATASAIRVPWWLVVLIAILALWSALLILRPLRFLPVRNPIAMAHIGPNAAKLEVDLHGTRLEEGDVFTVRLTLVGRMSPKNPCILSKGDVSASLTMPAADVAGIRPLHTYGPSCAADAEWIVAPKHAGRQIVAVAIAHRSGSKPDITSLETEVDIDRAVGDEAVLSGLVSVVVALIGIVTSRKESIA